MILRKPYAFIIKHFRLIHIFLSVCFGFIFMNINDIRNLLDTLHKTSTYLYVGTDNYINKSIYYFIVGALILCVIVYWLLRKKKKPSKIYFFMIIYLVASFASFAYLYRELLLLQEEVIDIDKLILIKDVSTLFTVPPIAFFVVCAIRGVGFNLKQFNFSKDVAELKIADVDSEEFEILIGQNNYKYMRFFRRTKRELGYYIKENKLMLITIVTCLVIIASGLGIYYYQRYLKKLSEEDATMVDGIAYTVKSSYITSLDYNGERVKKNYKYVVVNMSFFNSTQHKKQLDLTKIMLTNGDLIYYPTMTKNECFYDLGVPYVEGEYIEAQENAVRTLTFEIPNTVTTTNYTLNVQYGLQDSSTAISGLYRKFDVRANNIDTEPINYDKYLNEYVNTDVEGINQFDVIIKDYNVVDVFNNQYIRCSTLYYCETMSDIISTTKDSINTMLVLEVGSNFYNDANFTKTFNNINKVFEAYATVNYTLNNKKYSVPAKVVRGSYVDNVVFLNVERNFAKASDLSISFAFRNNKFKVKLRNHN